MSRKASRKEPASKSIKSSARSNATHNRTRHSSCAKWQAAKMLTVPSPEPENADICTALAQLESMMARVGCLSKTSRPYVDYCRLRFTMRTGFLALKTIAWKGGPNSQDAIDIIFSLTALGCELLEQGSGKEDLRPYVRETASLQPEWPVMMSPPTNKKNKYFESLSTIGLGTKSVPPTAHTKIDVTSPWTKVAEHLFRQIILFKGCLEIHEMEKHRSSTCDMIGGEQPFSGILMPDRHPIYRRMFEVELEQAQKWKDISRLSWETDSKTFAEWWAAADAILDDYLQANPEKAKGFCDRVGLASENEGKPPLTNVKKSIREAFEKRFFSPQ